MSDTATTAEQTERKVRLHATVDHYERQPFEFDVTVETNGPFGAEKVDGLSKAAALRALADYFESRVGTRAPWPSKRLVVEFDAD